MGKQLSNSRLVVAIALNLLLSVVEVVVGVVAGSLALIADAVHNFNDCASLVITLIARMISQKEADRRRTFGYQRAEVIGALINLTILIVVALFLLYEAVSRYFRPQEVDGWGMVLASAIALVIDIATVLLLYGMRKGSINLRAGFLHKLADALASVGVLVGGVVIILWQISAVDLIVTVAIAGFILWQAASLMGKTISILMESVPEDIDVQELLADLAATQNVRDVHHLHIWQLDEDHRALEAHVVIGREDGGKTEQTKASIKSRLREKFGIAHSTLEFEFDDRECEARGSVPRVCDV